MARENVRLYPSFSFELIKFEINAHASAYVLGTICD